MKKNFKKIILGILGTGILVGGAVVLQSSEKEQIAEEVLITNPKTVGWTKPVTDAEWADDVKKENFDIKSTGVLETMLESHTAKLAREEKAYAKYRDCPDCIRYEFRESLSSIFSGVELETEIEKKAQEAINNRAWSVEKLRQSVERMQNEIRLRDKGFVIVEGETLILGGLGDKIIRKIND
jgi:hypothetical protein